MRSHDDVNDALQKWRYSVRYQQDFRVEISNCLSRLVLGLFVNIFHMYSNKALVIETGSTSTLMRMLLGYSWRHNTSTAFVLLCSVGVKCVCQRHSDTLHSLGTEPRVDSLAVANLRSYPLSSTATSMDISVKCLSQGHSSALYSSNKQSYDYYSAL